MNDEVKRRREALGWSLQELAYRAGVTEQTIRNIESERVNPHRATLAQLMRALEEGEKACRKQ